MPPEMDRNQALVSPANVVENEEFDINFDLGVTSSQLSIQDVCSQSEVVEEVPVAGNANNNSSGSTIRNTTSSTSTTTRQTMQVQQTPFVLNNCSVTINYFNNN